MTMRGFSSHLLPRWPSNRRQRLKAKGHRRNVRRRCITTVRRSRPHAPNRPRGTRNTPPSFSHHDAPLGRHLGPILLLYAMGHRRIALARCATTDPRSKPRQQLDGLFYTHHTKRDLVIAWSPIRPRPRRTRSAPSTTSL
ncbi:hypothetical protein N9L68_08675 [bacterium]|nr:hypothetical protein [bacterium]